MTEFAPARKPRVRIAAELAYDERRENRYRTTLTHEYGHVHFHGYLFALQSASADLLQQARPAVQVCKRETIIDARTSDWMEWQAGYVSGALLMPISFIRKVVGIFQEGRGMFGPAASGTAEAAALIERIRSTFQVSADAARVRLTKLGFLATQARGLSLFSSSITTI